LGYIWEVTVSKTQLPSTSLPSSIMSARHVLDTELLGNVSLVKVERAVPAGPTIMSTKLMEEVWVKATVVTGIEMGGAM
jgi:hypothetical protein